MASQDGGGVSERVSEADLHVAGTLAQGGTSTIYELLGVGGALVYKKYNKPVFVPGSLSRLVAFRRDLSPRDKDFVDTHLAWPVATVANVQGDVVGTLLPRAPKEYWAHLSTGHVRARDLNYLIYQVRAARVGVEQVSLKNKLLILKTLAAALDFVQQRGFLHEDLSSNNALWTVQPNPSVYLLDCDWLHPTDGSAPDDPIFSTVDWTDPRVLSGSIARPDGESVVYSFALMVARVLGHPRYRPSASGSGSQVPLPPIVSERLHTSLACSIESSAPSPSLSEWIGVLSEAASDTSAEQVDTVKQMKGAKVRPLVRQRTDVSYRFKEQTVSIAGFMVGALLAALLLIVLL